MFYSEIMEHGVPLLDRAIRELRDRSMAIDVYVWLAYKLHVLQGRTPLRWPALYAQFGAGFATIKNFRPSFLDALAAATAAYPDALVTLGEEGIALYPSPPPIPYRSGGRHADFGWLTPHHVLGRARLRSWPGGWLVNPTG